SAALRRAARARAGARAGVGARARCRVRAFCGRVGQLGRRYRTAAVFALRVPVRSDVGVDSRRDDRRGAAGAALRPRGRGTLMPTLNNYLILSAILFAIGTAGVFVRRNLITILLSIEIMLNAVNLTFVAFGRALGSADGQIIVFFVMT